MVHPPPRARALRDRPPSRPTRGKTAPGRLRRVDTFVLLYDRALLARRDGPFADAVFVDVGFGDAPTTTLESARRFRAVHRDLAVVGVESDRARVDTARALGDGCADFRHGGFDLPLDAGTNDRPERARLIRAFNVLRQYEETEVGPAVARMGRYLVPGGLLVEGTSDPGGRLWVADVWRRCAHAASAGDLVGEAVVFSHSLRAPFEPDALRAVLPKRLIHRMVPGEPVYDLFEAWRRAREQLQSLSLWGPRRIFVDAARVLRDADCAVDVSDRMTRRGFLVWRGDAGRCLRLER